VKSEFEETILEDLTLMGVRGDVVSHTSDHFQELYDACIKMLQTGRAYADDTAQLKVCAILVYEAEAANHALRRCERRGWMASLPHDGIPHRKRTSLVSPRWLRLQKRV
jgi:glutamyl/glutaminyl-tRNA synthetase